MCELFVRRLADMIQSGELRVGEHLPPERQLAEQMGVSKSVAHSGLAELARIGLVTIKPQSGTYVADYMVTGNLETFNAIVRFNGNHLDADTVAAIFVLWWKASRSGGLQNAGRRRMLPRCGQT